MTDVVGTGVARETIGAGTGVLNVGGVVREAVVVTATVSISVILSGLAREAVVVPGTGIVPSAARQYAVSIIS